MTDAPGQHVPMTTPEAPAGRPAGATVCTACPLLCDDVTLAPAEGRFDRVCHLGIAAFRTGPRPAAEALIDGRPVSAVAGIEAAVARLAAARRAVFTGLDGLTIEGVTAACDLAESLGAAIAPPIDDLRLPGGSLLARSGEITAAWEEARDRADLVIFWGCDPTFTHPRFVERFVAPPPLAAPRRSIALGTTSFDVAPTPDHEQLRLDSEEDDIDVARLLVALLLDRPHGAASDRIHHAAATLFAAIEAARCVAIVTGRPDGIGISRWSVIELVRALSRRLPAFEIPLEASPRGANAAGARAALVWRYGAAATAPDVGAVEGGDALLALGRVPPHLDEPPLARIAPSSVIRIAPGPGDAETAGVWLRCRDLGDEPGTLLRADGRTVELAGSPGTTPSIVAILAAIRDRLADTGTMGRRGGAV